MARSNIGDVIAQTLAPAADIVNPESMADEEITRRVLQLKVDAGNAILEIGRWLSVMKERKAHGEWLRWLESVDIREHAAQRFMRLHREYSSNPTLVSDLGQTKALMLLAIPSEEREIFAEDVGAASMTKDELAQAIRERDEARNRAEEAEKAAETLKQSAYAATEERDKAIAKLGEAQLRVKELEARPVDVAVQVDEDACRKAADEARRKTVEEWQKKMEKLNDDLQKAEEKLKAAREKAKQGKADVDAGKAASAELDAARKSEADARAEAEQLRAELERARREQTQAAVAGDAELAVFQQIFESVQGDVNKMRGILLKVRGRDEALAGKLASALTALAEKVKECAK